MIEVNYKQKMGKFNAMEFTKALLGDIELKPRGYQSPTFKEKTREIEVQSRMLAYLEGEMNLGRLFAHRANNTPIYDKKLGAYRSLSKGQRKGFSDIYVLKDGVSYFFEVKKNNGKLSKDQIKMSNWIMDNGGKFALVRHLWEVINILDGKIKIE